MKSNKSNRMFLKRFTSIPSLTAIPASADVR